MTSEEAIKYGTDWLKDEYLDAKDRAFIKTAIKALEQEPLTDEEQRIFLAAMRREEKICKKEDNLADLVLVCGRIKRKVRAALWQ